MNRDPNKLPFGQKRCKSPKCGQVIVGLRTKICPHCGFDQMADNKVKPKPSMKSAKIATADATKRGPGRPPKVQVSVPVTRPEVIPDPFTFTVPVNSLMVIGTPVPKTKDNNFPPAWVRDTTMYNGVSEVVAKPDVVIRKAMRFAENVELPDLYGLALQEYSDESLNNMPSYVNSQVFDLSMVG